MNDLDIMEELTHEEIEILLSECDTELQKIRQEMGFLMVRKNQLKRASAKLNQEKEYLHMLKSGMEFNEFLTITPVNTLTTIKKQYNRIMKNYERIFPEKIKPKD